MKIFGWLAMCAGVCAMACVAFVGYGAENQTISPDVEKGLLADVDRELKAFGGNQSVPGAVLGLWMHGTAPWMRAVGLGNLSPREAMKLDDKFRVGSNTKTFVVTVLLQLVDEGKLSLDDSLAKFDVGVKVPNAEHITVRELCQMRSGLLDAYHAPELDSMNINAYTKITPRELVAIAVKHPPLFAPAVGRFAQGMIVEVPLQLFALPGEPSLDQIEQVLVAAYAGERFIEVALRAEAAGMKALTPESLNGTNRMKLFVFGDPDAGQARLVALLDNLGKGASGAAVQNLNLMLGLDEAAGLT